MSGSTSLLQDEGRLLVTSPNSGDGPHRALCRAHVRERRCSIDASHATNGLAFLGSQFSLVILSGTRRFPLFVGEACCGKYVEGRWLWATYCDAQRRVPSSAREGKSRNLSHTVSVLDPLNALLTLRFCPLVPQCDAITITARDMYSVTHVSKHMSRIIESARIFQVRGLEPQDAHFTCFTCYRYTDCS